MENSIFLSSSSGEFNLKAASENKMKLLKRELSQYKSIKVPNINYSISGEELAEWLLDVSSPREVEEIILMIQSVRNRGSKVKSILQTMAAALLK